MRTDDFDFALPADRIAQEPARPRDAARLLAIGEELHDRLVRDLPSLLRPGDLLVSNDTKVIPARLLGRRGAAAIEATLHRREADDRWRAFARPAKRLRQGDMVAFAEGFGAEVTEKGEGGEVVLRFSLGGAALMAALERHGKMPLPPYIRRSEGAGAADAADYQTLFARRAGAVAAPTAGLHFTPALLAAVDAAGIRRATLTLHVGAGTFLPVKTDDPRSHPMHAEWGEVDDAVVAAVASTRRAGGRVVAIGTTSLRLLEAASAGGELAPFSGMTDIFILPGYRFRSVDLLMTNFHLPRSTLFMLVAAFAGLDRMQAAYRHAVDAGYRFYSYGDACLIERAA
ncbi:MAG: tRNA preQ1(34) S-adenosylmethionine ribosyltransferase-isomerase QueA [Alphaproteobacteria bacterium]